MQSRPAQRHRTARDIATATDGLLWLLYVERGLLRPRPPPDALRFGAPAAPDPSTGAAAASSGRGGRGRGRAAGGRKTKADSAGPRTLAELLALIRTAGYEPSDNYGQVETGYEIVEHDGPPCLPNEPVPAVVVADAKNSPPAHFGMTYAELHRWDSDWLLHAATCNSGQGRHLQGTSRRSTLWQSVPCPEPDIFSNFARFQRHWCAHAAYRQHRFGEESGDEDA